MTAWFTYFAGLASILGLLIQIFGLFPRYEKLRKQGLILALGIFIGSLSGLFEASSVRLDVTVSGFQLLLALFAVVILGFLIAGAVIRDSNRREGYYAIAGLGFGAFLVVLFFGSMMTGLVDSPNLEKSKLTVGELHSLASQAESRHNYERAIMHLESIRSRLEEAADRGQLVDEEIDKVKRLQFK